MQVFGAAACADGCLAVKQQIAGHHSTNRPLCLLFVQAQHPSRHSEQTDKLLWPLHTDKLLWS